jgi:hypothetical protein
MRGHPAGLCIHVGKLCGAVDQCQRKPTPEYIWQLPLITKLVPSLFLGNCTILCEMINVINLTFYLIKLDIFLHTNYILVSTIYYGLPIQIIIKIIR